MAIKLIVGLGNPGSSYQYNRHNYGFILLDYIAKQLQVDFRCEKKFFGDMVSVNIAGNSVYLFKPNQYMNNSGRSVNAIVRFYDIAINDILIAYDDIDLDFGMLRFKYSGGHGGHNGLKDIINNLSSKDFHRLRLGVGRPNHGSVVDFVLSNFSKQQQDIVQKNIADSYALLDNIVSDKIADVMQILHTKT